MTIIYLWAYTLALALFWGLFIVAKIHAYKFKNLSLHITKVTRVFMIISVLLSLIGYAIILFGIWGNGAEEIEVPSIQFENNFDSQSTNY